MKIDEESMCGKNQCLYQLGENNATTTRAKGTAIHNEEETLGNKHDNLGFNKSRTETGAEQNTEAFGMQNLHIQV